MFQPVKMTLHKDGYPLLERVAQSEDDLCCTIEMCTGCRHLDVLDLYRELLNSGRQKIRETFKVCHSYEKWGDLQQEVCKVKVQLEKV